MSKVVIIKTCLKEFNMVKSVKRADMRPKWGKRPESVKEVGNIPIQPVNNTFSDMILSYFICVHFEAYPSSRSKRVCPAYH